MDEAEVLTVEETRIESQLSQCPRYRSQGEGHVALSLAPTHLCVHHIVVHRVEAQEVGGQLTVEREAAAIAGGRAQGVAVGHPVGGLHEEHVVGQTLGISSEPQSERRGHGHLQMGVARHEHVLELLALGDELVEEILDERGRGVETVTDEELQVEQHLVVAAAARVNLLAHVTEFTCEQQLHLRVDILHPTGFT